MIKGFKLKKWLFIVLAVIVIVPVSLVILNWFINQLRLENKQSLQKARTNQLAEQINAYVFKKIGTITEALAQAPEVIDQQKDSNNSDNEKTLIVLNTTKTLFKADIVYELDQSGKVIACSPYSGGKTLTGKSYPFRPYFSKVMKESKSILYPALGTTTNKRGLYFSSPVYENKGRKPSGVVVIKIGLEEIDSLITNSVETAEYPIALLSPDGIVFAGNKKDWLFQAALPITEEKLAAIKKSKQFANESLNSLPVTLDKNIITLNEDQYHLITKSIAVSGWKLVTLEPEKVNFELLPFHRIILITVLSVIVVLSSVLILIIISMLKRRAAEKKLKDNQSKLENLLEQRTNIIIEVRNIISGYTTSSFTLAATAEETASALHHVKSNMETINDKVMSLDTEVKLTNLSIDEIKGSISTVVEKILSQVTSFKGSSLSIEEMSAFIHDIAKGSVENLKVVKELEQSGIEGEKEMGNTRTIINKVAESANLIMEMIAVINNIAEQTNLLAMNAAIEAAHAGDAGKGFAVVADEIRKLAEDTSRNSIDISKSLKEVIEYIRSSEESTLKTSQFFASIVENIKNVAGSMTGMNDSMQNLSLKSNEVMGSLGELIQITNLAQESSNTMNDKVTEISLSMSELRSVYKETRNSISEITAAIQELSLGAENIAQSGVENNSNVARLEELVTAFQTEEETVEITEKPD